MICGRLIGFSSFGARATILFLISSSLECTEHHCSSFKVKLDACTERVEGNPETEETCVEEFFDLMVKCFSIFLRTYSISHSQCS
ncbi:hypothetical protein BJ742DRAFT_714130 [Cladochytrium replicatum]|nr:hypothetical protein BJ742DRAFT_714130 [Cladochytrium replicatum]